MDLIYPINFVGHDVWMDSGYEPKLAHGDVITRDGEVLGSWRVVDYDHEDEYSSGRFEFTLDGEDIVKFAEDFAMLDVRTSRGFALSNLTRTTRSAVADARAGVSGSGSTGNQTAATSSNSSPGLMARAGMTFISGPTPSSNPNSET